MNHWEIIKSVAEKYLQFESPLFSFVKGRRYGVIDINEKRIKIDRLDGGNSVSLTKTRAIDSIYRLEKKKRFKKGDLLTPVTLETALVTFHPSIKWDSETKEVYWRTGAEENFEFLSAEYISEASDDEIEKVRRLISKRKNASKFRKNLISVYRQKCAISDKGPEMVLEACHILDHSIYGKNDSTNGLLLRSDLHILFDAGLLLIHPLNLTVHLHNSLQSSDYATFEGKKINSRRDGKVPNEEYLKEKWNKSNWTNKLL